MQIIMALPKPPLGFGAARSKWIVQRLVFRLTPNTFNFKDPKRKTQRSQELQNTWRIIFNLHSIKSNHKTKEQTSNGKGGVGRPNMRSIMFGLEFLAPPFASRQKVEEEW